MNKPSSHSKSDKVSDAIRHSWVYYLPRAWWPYAQLARWERPIGWQLLMWPCWWSVALGVLASRTAGLGEGMAESLSETPGLAGNLLKLVPLFFSILVPLLLGAIVMRGAGCTYNDLADINIDNQVERTRSRPLPSGRISKKQAWLFLVLQCLMGLVILSYLSRYSVFVFWLGAASLVLVAIYPFMKRITWWPQLFLGLAFSWGAVMGWAIIWHNLSLAPVLLYAGSICWVIGYDTIYAHQDREDDAIVGVKSTARLFGEKSKGAISLLYAAAFVLFSLAWHMSAPVTLGWTWPAWAGLAMGAAHFAWQIFRLDIDDGDQCLRLFKSNGVFGLILFAGLIATLVVAP